MLMFCLDNLCQFFCAFSDRLLHLVGDPLPLSALGEHRHFLCWPAVPDSLLFILSDAVSLAFFAGQSSFSKENNECVSSSFLQSSLLYSMLVGATSGKWEQKDAISRGTGKPYTTSPAP